MEILRQGSNRKTGWVAIKAKKPPVVSVEPDLKGGVRVTLSLRRTKDPDRDGEYDHDVRLSFADVASVIDALAGLGISKFNEELSVELAGSLRSLHRLAAAVSGIQVLSDSVKK